MKYQSIEKEQPHNKDKWLHIGITVFIILIIVAIGYLVYRKEQRWQQFAAEHHCKITQKIAGSIHTTTIVTSDGKTTHITQQEKDKTAYLCDDGVVYWR